MRTFPLKILRVSKATLTFKVVSSSFVFIDYYFFFNFKEAALEDAKEDAVQSETSDGSQLLRPKSCLDHLFYEI